MTINQEVVEYFDCALFVNKNRVRLYVCMIVLEIAENQVFDFNDALDNVPDLCLRIMILNQSDFSQKI